MQRLIQPQHGAVMGKLSVFDGLGILIALDRPLGFQYQCGGSRVNFRRHVLHRSAGGRAGVVCMILAAAVFLAEVPEFSIRGYLGSRQYRCFKSETPCQFQKLVFLLW